MIWDIQICVCEFAWPFVFCYRFFFFCKCERLARTDWLFLHTHTHRHERRCHLKHEPHAVALKNVLNVYFCSMPMRPMNIRDKKCQSGVLLHTWASHMLRSPRILCDSANDRPPLSIHYWCAMSDDIAAFAFDSTNSIKDISQLQQHHALQPIETEMYIQCDEINRKIKRMRVRKQNKTQTYFSQADHFDLSGAQFICVRILQTETKNIIQFGIFNAEINESTPIIAHERQQMHLSVRLRARKFTCKRCRTEQNDDVMRDDATGFRVGVGVVAVAGNVRFKFMFCIDCFNGEFRMNSSKSSSTSSNLGGVPDSGDALCVVASLVWAMRKLISKSNGLLCWFVLNDNERANELLNVGHALVGDCGLFGKRTSLLWRRVSIFSSFYLF